MTDETLIEQPASDLAPASTLPSLDELIFVIQGAIIDTLQGVKTIKQKLYDALSTPDKASQADLDHARNQIATLEAQLATIQAQEATEDADTNEKLSKLVQAMQALKSATLEGVQ